MPRRIFPASSVTNTTGAPIRLSFHYTQTGGQRATDLWTVDGSNYTSAGIPNGTVLTDASGNYSAFAGPDDVDTLWVAPHTGAARTQITATATVANGTTVDSGTYVQRAGGTSITAAPLPFLNVRDYGVVADGVTDDTAALNAMLAALPNNTVVRFPQNKTIRITSALSASATSVTFEGRGCTILLDPAAAAGTVMLNLFGDYQTIDGLTFDTSGVSSATCARPRANWQTVRNCTFLNPKAGGVYIQGGNTKGAVEGCKFFGNGYGILFDSACTGSSYVIRGNVFNGNGAASGDAIEVNTPTGGASDIVITGNIISGYQSTNPNQGMGIGVANANRVVISNNTIRDCQLDGVHIEDRSSGCVVSGNAIYNCGRSGISLQVGAGTIVPTNTSITGNTVIGCGWNAGTGGIALEGATPIKNATVSSNIVRGCGRAGAATYYGIDLGGGASGVVVAANIVYNTVGVYASGIRASSPSSCMFFGNRCADDQGTKTQQYGMTISGTATEVVVMGNHLTGNVNAIDEFGINSGSALLYKQGNRPNGVDGPLFLPDIAGPVTDTNFRFQQPNSALVADSAANKLYMRCGSSTWKSVTLA